MRIERRSIEHSVEVGASVEAVWREATEVDIAAFRHPAYLRILGIPKPLRAELLRSGVGGARIAHFSNDCRFTQEITGWEPGELFAFTFRADPGFRVAYFLDLSDGPFRLVAGAYRMTRTESGTRLSLSSEYELKGLVGALLAWPVRLVLHFFQLYLLRGIRKNSERRDLRPA